MDTKKIVIGSGLVILVAGVAWYLLRDKPGTETKPGTDVTPSKNVTSSGYPDGTLLRAGSDDKVYIINANGQKQWIMNRKKFDAMGLNMKSVLSIPKIEIEKIPSGSNLAGILF